MTTEDRRVVDVPAAGDIASQGVATRNLVSVSIFDDQWIYRPEESGITQPISVVFAKLLPILSKHQPRGRLADRAGSGGFFSLTLYD